MIEICIAGRIREVRLRAACRCSIGVVVYCEVSHETKKIFFSFSFFNTLWDTSNRESHLIKADCFTSD